VKKVDISPNSRRTFQYFPENLEGRLKGELCGEDDLNQAIREGTMNWVVAAFQGVMFADLA
jgi:hypothetical protein